MTGLAALAGVLLVAFLLGGAVWVVGITTLGWLISRASVTVGTLVRAAVVILASGLLYVAVVVTIGLLLPA